MYFLIFFLTNEFRGLVNREASSDAVLQFDAGVTFLTLRLYYYDDLIEEQYFKEGDMEWVQA